MSPNPEPPPGEEHNPDNLTPEQVGHGWRLLRVGETPDIGDEVFLSCDGLWRPLERRYNGPINEAFLCAYRRRIHPPAPEPTEPAKVGSAEQRIAELTEENARLREELYRLKGELSDCKSDCEYNEKKLNEAVKEIAWLKGPRT